MVGSFDSISILTPFLLKLYVCTRKRHPGVTQPYSIYHCKSFIWSLDAWSSIDELPSTTYILHLWRVRMTRALHFAYRSENLIPESSSNAFQ